MKHTKVLEPEDFPGAMMVYKPMTKRETKMMAEWVEKRKTENKNKKKGNLESKA